MQVYWDAIVIGTGPAGLSFAAKAADLGLDILAVDEQPAPGGQIYRNIENHPPDSLELMGADYRYGLSLIQRFRSSRAVYLPDTTAWKIEPDGRLCCSTNGRSVELKAKRIVIAIGAMERPVPFPGWTLPGVIGVGAADTLYKSSGIVPKGPVVMVGNGPLMFSAAVHLDALGVNISHFIETAPRFSTLRALPYLPPALAKPGYLFKGLSMMLKARAVPEIKVRNVTKYAGIGTHRIEHFSFTHGRRKETVKTDTVLVHEGVIPRSEFARQLGLSLCWNPVQRYWYPRVDPYGRTSEDHIYITGDNSFVHGAAAAEKKGWLTAIDIAADLTRMPHGEKQGMAAPVLKSLNRELSPRPFVDAAYRPRSALYDVDDNTLVCRCEEVTAQQIRSAVIQGMKTPETVKSLTRCGMGPCQSRMCGSGLAEIIAEETGQMMPQLTPVTIRPPVRNLSIGELTQMELIKDVKNFT